MQDAASDLPSPSTESQVKESGPDVQTIQANIGQLTLENDFLEKAVTRLPSLPKRKDMIDRSDNLRQ